MNNLIKFFAKGAWKGLAIIVFLVIIIKACVG